MKLVDMIPVTDSSGYKLVSTIDDYEVKIGNQTWETIRGMGAKSLEELDECERWIYDKLKPRGHMTDGQAEIRPRGSEGLHMLAVEVTDSCNLRCRHCYLGEKAKVFLGKREYERTVEDAVELGAYAISFTGGEIVLDRYLFDRITFARERGCKTTAVTNGTMLTREHAKEFKRRKMESIAVTINGFKSEHEGLYGKGTFEPAVRGATYLVEEGNAVVINFNLYEGNAHILPEFEEFCRRSGFRGLNVSHIKPVGWGEQMRGEILKETPRCCGKGGREQVMIKADGRIVPCAFLEDEVWGNVYQDRFKDVYKRRANRR